MRCDSCNKFVGLDFSDPELESIEVDGTSATATVRIVRTCSDCGQELKEATLEMEDTFDGPKDEDAAGEDKEHDLSVEDDSVEQIEEGGGRYAKSYFGASVRYTVSCACGCGFTHSGDMSDKIAASQMDEMV